MKKVVITGASSPLGLALVDELLLHDIEILAICRRNSKRILLIPKADRIKVVECNLDELNSMGENIGHRYDIFYHFAWASTAGNILRDNIEAHIDNIKFTIDAVELAKKLGCKRFIGSGSQAEYGRVKERLNESIPVNPESAYGIAKLCAGQMSKLKCMQLGMEHIWTRILSVYGPYDSDKTVVMSVIKSLLRKEIPICTLGEQIWNFLYSKDAAKALYLLGKSGVDGKTYCIGSGEERKLREYIEDIRECVNPNAKIGWGEVPYSKNQVMHLCVDISELKRDTGFEERYSFKKGIKEICEYLIYNDRCQK